MFAFQRKAKLPEGADLKTMLPRKPRAKNEMCDSSISPSGLLERLVLRRFIASVRHHRPCVDGTM